jgi:CPA2 family monovalent cation:H+ antiporter-2
MSNQSLIATIVVALGLAFVFGAIAHRLKIPLLIGYIVAGVIIGPFTPGYVADQSLALQLAEVGVILLMFGVGLHFSLHDLLSVKAVAIPGAIGQMAVVSALGFGLSQILGWTPGAGLVFGLALSVASTVVVLRAMQERRLVDTDRGRIITGWLIVEDLAMVIVLVILPALALCVAFGSAELFGVSFALGAFFAGMVLAESTLSQQAAQETLPLRDAFAVLFFVSVGMLFNPEIVVREPGPVLATFVVIVGGNALAAFLIVLALRQSVFTAATSAAALSQIGEFSFILAGLGVSLQVLPENGRDLILAGAILSILANPLLFFALGKASPWLGGRTSQLQPATAAPPVPDELPVTSLRNHAVIIGCGRVGSLVVEAMATLGQPFLVIEERREVVDRLRARGIEAITGNAAQFGIMEAANLPGARWFISAIPNPFENGNLIEQARAANSDLEIIARAHSDDEVEHLSKFGANLIIMGEREIARGITEHIARRLEERESTPHS